jgi:hypothetical protein
LHCVVAAKETEMIGKALKKMVDTTGIEALIVDPIQFCVELGAMKVGIPYITVATALYPSSLLLSGRFAFIPSSLSPGTHYFGYTPLCVYDWSHETTPGALARKREGVVNFARWTYNWVIDMDDA